MSRLSFVVFAVLINYLGQSDLKTDMFTTVQITITTDNRHRQTELTVTDAVGNPPFP